MKSKYCVIIFIGCISVLSCTKTMLNPLKGSINKTDNNIGSNRDIGYTLYLKPRKTLEVRAIENCIISNILSTNDSSYMVITRGRVNAAYGNLAKSYVIKGDSIRRGQILGVLFSNNAIRDNSLELALEKNGRSILPNW